MGGTAHGHHYYKGFDTCQREFWWQSIQGIRTKSINPGASLGRMIHHAMYFRFQGKPMEEVLQLSEAAELKELLDTSADYDVDALQECIREFERLMGWFDKWTPKHPLRMIEGELEGEFLIQGISEPYTYRIDSIGEDERGQLWVVDVKSTKKTFPNLFRQFEMDYQLMGYVLGARSRDINVKGAVVRAFRKLKRVKDPNELFQDEQFIYSERQLNEFKRNRLWISQDIELLGPRHQDAWRKNPDQCFSIRGECPYYKLCRYPETEAQTLEAYYVKEEKSGAEQEVDDLGAGDS